MIRKSLSRDEMKKISGAMIQATHFCVMLVPVVAFTRLMVQAQAALQAVIAY